MKSDPIWRMGWKKDRISGSCGTIRFNMHGRGFGEECIPVYVWFFSRVFILLKHHQNNWKLLFTSLNTFRLMYSWHTSFLKKWLYVVAKNIISGVLQSYWKKKNHYITLQNLFGTCKFYTTLLTFLILFKNTYVK